jgi:diacylglycerol kinase family enzyme
VNPRSGDSRPTVDELAEAARAIGVRCHILAQGDDPAALAQRAKSEALGVAGGDGSLAPVAAVALERGLPFVCVPYGTRNHFARDLGLARDDPLGTLAAFAGVERRIDVARVNDRLFLNNLSLGLYASLVLRRERHRRRGEALAGLKGLLRLARERHRLRARVDGETLRARVLLVANNAYEISLYTLGARATLDEGRLHLYAAGGWLPTSWLERTARSFQLEIDDHRVIAAADGEPLTLEPPLKLECLPRALRILVPPAREDGAGSAQVLRPGGRRGLRDGERLFPQRMSRAD